MEIGSIKIILMEDVISQLLFADHMGQSRGRSAPTRKRKNGSASTQHPNRLKMSNARTYGIGAVCLLAVLLASCKTCIPIVEVRDSVRVEQRLDSVYIYQHDSIFRDRWRNGDTVFVVQEKYKTLYKDKIVEVHDTIRTEQNIVQERKVVPSFYKGCTIALWVLVVLAVLGIAVRVLIKVYLKR